MFKEVIGYDLICDGCGDSYCKNTEYFCYASEEDTEAFATEYDDWGIHEKKHYCPDCYKEIMQPIWDDVAAQEEHDYKQATR